MKARQKPGVVFQPTVHQSLQRGIATLVDAIRPTLGPVACGVAIDPLNSAETLPEYLDSGGLIARRIIELPNRNEDMGAMLADPEQKDWAEAVRIIYPTFEGGGTHMNVSGMALTRAAPHKEAAIRLMEFLSSEAAQKIYAETNTEFPVKPGVALSPLVASWGPFTPDTINLMEVAKQRPAALKLMEEVNFDG